ncbi:hypothetical protein GHK79_11840 [Enterococcus faecium]|nr:hypothetical protein [Enterococcus faecium]MBL3708501.1 hypothetical protein [Enterococcus faecium]
MSDMPLLMNKLGFFVLENEADYLYLLTISHEYFLVVESREIKRGIVYDFCKYCYHKRKKETELINIYFTGIQEIFALKKIASFMKYMLEHGYFKTSDQSILEFSKKIINNRF